MLEQSLATISLVIATVALSYKGFKDSAFTARYEFNVERVFTQKEYIRLIGSGFLHNNWPHLLFNMLALLAFGASLEPFIGSAAFLLLYFASMVGGKLLALWVHKSHSDYSSVGASGAVNGIIYSSIALFPYAGIGLFLLPLSIPAWVFGLIYMGFSIYGLKAGWGATNHAAHLGGALVGLLLTALLYPSIAAANILPIAVIAVPTLGFLLLLIYKPHILLTSGSRVKAFRSADHEYNYRRTQEQLSIDGILEKIHRNGMKSLTAKEKEALERYSKTKR